VITDARFVGRAVLAVGAAKQVGERAPYTYPTGVVVVLNVGTNEANVAGEIKLEQPATWAPLIDASLRARSFAAHTPHRALLIDF
jgi:hypothetical protein